MKTVLVTGVSRGLGLAIARRLVDDGFRVIGYSRTLSDEVREMCDEAPDRMTFRPLDMSDLDAVADEARRAVKEDGPVFGLVNNAGIGLDGVLGTMHRTDIEKVIRVNLLGPITFCKYVSRSMMARRDGRIVNISSIIASTGFHGLSVYAASKAGLEGFTRSLSREVGKMSVTVNCVAPGYMETEMTAAMPANKLDSIRRRAPLGLPRPQEVAGAVAHLLGPDAARTTGSVITIDGGSTA